MKNLTKYFLLSGVVISSCAFATGCIDKSDPMYLTFEYAQQNGYTGSYSNWKSAYVSQDLEFRLVDGDIEYNIDKDWNMLCENTNSNPSWFASLADGTLGFDVEEYYSVNFNTNSTNVIERQIVSPGDKAVEPNAITKENYVFTAWYDDSSVYDFDSEVNSRVDLDASWYIDGIIFNDFIYDETTEEYTLRVGASIDSIDLSDYLETQTYYTVNGNNSTIVNLNEGENSFIIVNSEANTDGESSFTINISRNFMYEVTFNYLFDTKDDTSTVVYVEEGSKLVSPDLNVAGYTYSIDFDFTSEIDSDITIDVTYTAIEYTITFNTDGGNAINSVNAFFNTDVVLPTPVKARHEFLGWYDENDNKVNIEDFMYTYSSDITLIAKWVQNEFYIELDANNGELPDVYPTGYDKNNDEILLPDATRLGYTFLGWYDEDNNLYLSIAANSETDFDLIAKWEANEYEVTFNVDGGEAISSYTATFDSNYNLPITTKAEFVFNGWLYDGEKFNLSGVWSLDENIELTASWIVCDYSISYELNGGINNSNNPYGFNNDELLAIDDASKTGYTFLGWYYDEELTQKFDNTINDDITLYASFEANKYTVTYDVAGGVNLSNNTLQVTYDELFTLSSTSKLGYKFIGWKLDDELFTEGTWNLVSDITLVALYEEADYTITYVLNGGNNDITNAQGFDDAEEVLLTDAIAMDGYEFSGWFYDEALTEEFDNSKYENITLYASYTAKEYTITYNVGGGELLEDTIATYDEDYTLETPIFNGWNFIRWELADGTVFTEGNWKLLEDVTLIARYELITYTITYELTDGDNSELNVFEYTWEDEVVLYNATRQLDNFDGWLLDGEKVSQIDYESYGDKHFVASFTAATYNITYVNDGNAISNTATYSFDDNEIILQRASHDEYFFSYWSIDSKGLVDATTLNQDILRLLDSTDLTLYAIFTNNPMQNLVYTDVNHLGETQSYIYYGYFPQSVETNEEAIANLSSQLPNDRNELGYYEYNGLQYAKVLSNLSSTSYTFNNGDQAYTNTTYFFKVEDIKWNIYYNEDGSMYVMSEYILDAQVFNNSNNSDVDGNAVYGNNYEYSDIRKYLNDSFFTTAFTEEQQNSIINTNVVNSVTSEYIYKHNDVVDFSYSNEEYLSNDTNDNIYLLSFEHMLNEDYGYEDTVSTIESRTATVTDYAIARGILLFTADSKVGYWWTRTPMETATKAIYINGRGELFSMDVKTETLGVRPAFNFSL